MITGGKRKNHKKGVLDRQKAQRKVEAEARQAKYNSLTTQQKLDKLDAGKFVATKQRAKLKAQFIGK